MRSGVSRDSSTPSDDTVDPHEKAFRLDSSPSLQSVCDELTTA
jgi:hypothetical protein